MVRTQQKRKASTSASALPDAKRRQREAAPATTSHKVVPGYALQQALEYLDSESLLAATLVSPDWNALMEESGKHRVLAATRAWLPVIPSRESRKSIPVERFYRLQFLGSLGVWCPRPGRSVIPDDTSPMAVPFPLSLPRNCEWDAVRRAVWQMPNGCHVVARVRNGEGREQRALVVQADEPPAEPESAVLAHARGLATVGVTPEIAAEFRRLWPDCPLAGWMRIDLVWPRKELSARVGPWVVTVPCRNHPATDEPVCYREVVALHATTLEPCHDGRAWVAGRCTEIAAGQSLPPRRRLVAVSASCAVLYEQPRLGPVSASGGAAWRPFVPTHVLWCSPRSGSDALVVRRLPEVPEKRRRLGAAWSFAPHDFRPENATLAVRTAGYYG